MSVISARAFSMEKSRQWGLIMCGIPGGPQGGEIFPSTRKTIHINSSSKGNILQMSPFYFLVTIIKLFQVF